MRAGTPVLRLWLLLATLAFACCLPAAQGAVAQSLADDLVNGTGAAGGDAANVEPVSEEDGTVPPVTDSLETASMSIEGGPDYEAWEKVAKQAREVLEADRASSLALEQLRERLAEWRAQFQDAQSTNSNRIDILRRQIDALGPAPDTDAGESEAEELAERRSELNSQLSRLLVPVRAAQEAYILADGLIGEVDAVLRDRQTRELLDVGPSPLFPANWTEPLSQLAGVGDTLQANLRSSWQNTAQQDALRKNLAPAILVALIGLVLVVRGRAWSMALSARLLRSSGRQQRTMIFAMLVSVGQLVLPQIGLVLIVLGIRITGIGGLLTDQILQTIPIMGIMIFGARWLGSHSFPKIEILPPPLEHDEGQRASGRLWATLAGVSGALSALLVSLTAFSGITEEAASFLNFPILLLGAVALSRLGHLLVVHARASEEDEPDELTSSGFRAKVVHLIGRAAVLLALAGPVLAVLGYLKAGDFLVSAPLSTLAVLAVVSLFQRFFTHLYALFFGRQADGSDGLVAVLISFVIMLLALPFLALIWGARVADLTELWQRFMAGFSIGESTISPSNFLLFAVVFVLGYMLTRLLQGALRTSVLPKTRIDTGGQTAILSGVSYVGIFLAAVVAITAAGIDLSSLAIVAGALSVGIGFGLQTIVSNFVSGIILLIERPISEGDWISSGGVMGIVKKISVRSTRIETFDRTDVIVPNADLISGQVTNYTKTNMSGRLIVPVGVAYGSDTRRVAELLQEVAEEHPIVILNPPPQVVFTGFGADSLDFEVRVILRDVFSIIAVQTEIRHRIAERFAEEGIEIPFAQRDLWLRNPEALAGAIAGGASVEAPGADGLAAAADGEEPTLAEPEAPSRAAARVGLTKDDVDGADGDGVSDGDGGGDR
ncbi:mechanosensitive ion channel family protein [Oceanicola sp. D3]|uniref:DUF3772 domain-containing protein n=1 Tax=Oceanicola sp. D3 TaxID=2587163 RepID=UPI001121C861|nr:DUF3772 domain-containing protein [Oceanicola sp. D3]QDC10112.1 mechanosensitive ion channel family protein [Oceanicola sp. D3]